MSITVSTTKSCTYFFKHFLFYVTFIDSSHPWFALPSIWPLIWVGLGVWEPSTGGLEACLFPSFPLIICHMHLPYILLFVFCCLAHLIGPSQDGMWSTCLFFPLYLFGLVMYFIYYLKCFNIIDLASCIGFVASLHICFIFSPIVDCLRIKCVHFSLYLSKTCLVCQSSIKWRPYSLGI